jgi:hypothetical protein
MNTKQQTKKQVFAKTIDFFSALSFDETFKHKFSLAAVVGKRKRRHLERVRRPASTTQKMGRNPGKGGGEEEDYSLSLFPPSLLLLLS